MNLHQWVIWWKTYAKSSEIKKHTNKLSYTIRTASSYSRMISCFSTVETYCIWLLKVRSSLFLKIQVINNLPIGEDFNYSAILDDYQITKELGQGGFGKVMLGKHKEEKKEVAIKFMDVSENCKTYYHHIANSIIC